MRGIDVHQDKGDPDWKKVKAAGYAFAWLKVSEGVGFPPTDEWYRRNRAAARAAGLRVGGYHYLTTKGGGSTPEQEAAFFLSRLDLEPGDLLPVCDYEQEPAAGNQAVTFLEAVEEAIGERPILYTYPDYLARSSRRDDLRRLPLWLASYGPNDGELHAPSVPAGFKLVAHQFTSKGSIPGGVRGDVDLNELRGDDLDRITYRPSGPATRTVRFELVHSGQVVRASAPVKPGSLRERLAFQTFLLRQAGRIGALLARGEVTIRRRSSV
jgi:lysozyme